MGMHMVFVTSQQPLSGLRCRSSRILMDDALSFVALAVQCPTRGWHRSSSWRGCDDSHYVAGQPLQTETHVSKICYPRAIAHALHYTRASPSHQMSSSICINDAVLPTSAWRISTCIIQRPGLDTPWKAK